LGQPVPVARRRHISVRTRRIGACARSATRARRAEMPQMFPTEDTSSGAHKPAATGCGTRPKRSFGAGSDTMVLLNTAPHDGRAAPPPVRDDRPSAPPMADARAPPLGQWHGPPARLIGRDLDSSRAPRPRHASAPTTPGPWTTSARRRCQRRGRAPRLHPECATPSAGFGTRFAGTVRQRLARAADGPAGSFKLSAAHDA
jgi:hypothetical protein